MSSSEGAGVSGAGTPSPQGEGPPPTDQFDAKRLLWFVAIAVPVVVLLMWLEKLV